MIGARLTVIIQAQTSLQHSNNVDVVLETSGFKVVYKQGYHPHFNNERGFMTTTKTDAQTVLEALEFAVEPNYSADHIAKVLMSIRAKAQQALPAAQRLVDGEKVSVDLKAWLVTEKDRYGQAFMHKRGDQWAEAFNTHQVNMIDEIVRLLDLSEPTPPTTSEEA